MDAPPLPETLLGHLSPKEFLDEYWQKKPLLVRDALPGFTSPLEPGELAGLALDDEVASRIILEGETNADWELREGPFDEDDFLSLPETHWTLLVQEVDRLVPDVAALLDAFSFLPDWRIDDVMISYAPEGGNVGAHIDNYDVFLVQGLGHRNWQYGHAPVEDESIVEGADVRVLSDFQPDEEHVLGPGDMLYLPPRVAHHGVAMDDCMTYSVGFRAPTHETLVASFVQHALEHSVDPDARYSDPDLAPAEHPGEIDAAALDRVRGILNDALGDETAMDRWFGRHVTRPQRDRIVVPPESTYAPADVVEAIEDGVLLRRSPASRLAYVEHDDGSATLFADGDALDLSADLAYAGPLLTGRDALPASRIAPHLDDDALLDLITDLVNRGTLELESAA